MLKRIRARAWGASILAIAAVAVLVAVLGSEGGGVAGAAQSRLVAASAKLAPSSPTIPAQQSCASFASWSGLAGLPRYPTAISSATVVPAASGNPEYCDVKGMIAPQTHFDLQLPTKTWQGPLPAERLRRLLRDGQQPDLPFV
jgi:hypothetical protein